MRATQKKIISKPVTRTDDGKYLSNAVLDFEGYSGVQSKVENGHKADENQVSNTSSSLVKFPRYPSSLANFFASSKECATKTS